LSNSLLLILTRNPELGKCKTRLAAKVGDKAALEIYQFLLQRTVSFTEHLRVEKWKKLQVGKDLGERMQNAFRDGFQAGFEKVIIIGSDMYHLEQADLEEAFSTLETHDYVIGPAEDGGYYLLGMKSLNQALFWNKQWGTDTVLADTMQDLKTESVALLNEKNDVDYYEDIKDIKAFEPFIKHIKQ
jgi:glycosyltransferase A (GT-A) superfamily protein (DUF2064 family)